MGSMISLVAVLGFVIVVWEALRSARGVSFYSYLATSIEWQQKFPPADHRYMEIPMVSG